MQHAWQPFALTSRLTDSAYSALLVASLVVTLAWQASRLAASVSCSALFHGSSLWGPHCTTQVAIPQFTVIILTYTACRTSAVRGNKGWGHTTTGTAQVKAANGSPHMCYWLNNCRLADLPYCRSNHPQHLGSTTPPSGTRHSIGQVEADRDTHCLLKYKQCLTIQTICVKGTVP